MLPEDRHFYLYAKRHYKRGDVLVDLKHIYDHVMCHDAGAEENMICRLLHITHSHMDKPDMFVEFVSNLDPTGRSEVFGMTSTLPRVVCTERQWRERLVEKCLQVLACQPVDGSTIDLGEPSIVVLPLSEDSFNDILKTLTDIGCVLGEVREARHTVSFTLPDDPDGTGIVYPMEYADEDDRDEIEFSSDPCIRPTDTYIIRVKESDESYAYAYSFNTTEELVSWLGV